MKIAAIIQARMGSSRLPGKAMINIAGKPSLQYALERTQQSRRIQEIYLIATINPKDDILKKLAESNGIKCYRGSETDVLDSYYKVAKITRADIIVRITGDCPLIDYKIIDQVIKTYLSGNFDYVSNVHPPTYPDGLDVEVFSFTALETAWKNTKLKSEREHVTPYIENNPQIFKMKNVAYKIDLSNYRWTLDTAEDLQLLRLIIGECNKSKKYCDLEAILKIVKQHPDWIELNKHIQRNEGYVKSLKEDALMRK